MSEVQIPVETQGADSKTARLALAYQEVFGQSGNRTSSQRLVLESVRDRACQDLPIFDADKNGAFDPLRAAHRDGARTVYLFIERMLERARNMIKKQDKPKSVK
jgi:hypothetical protein